MKKICIILLMVLGFVGAKADDYDFSAVCSSGQTLYYNILSDSTVEVTYPKRSYENYYYGYERPTGNLIIPSSIVYNGCNRKIVEIGDNAFRGCANLNSIIIPTGVLKIEGCAFYGCNNLITINIPIGVEELGGAVFKDCGQLRFIELPNTIMSIGNSAFENCSMLASITIPNGLTMIGGSTFKDCVNLQTINIPNSVNDIGNGAFINCRKLKMVVLPDGIIDINPSIFSGCSQLKYVDVPNSVETVGMYAFENCISLDSINLSDNVRSIGMNAFFECNNLKKLDIPSGLDKILQYTFYNCQQLQHIVIPDGVVSIGNGAFKNCKKLKSVVIPNSVQRIGEYAFFGCSTLDSLLLGESISSIGYYAFGCCPIKVLEYNSISYGGNLVGNVYHAPLLDIKNSLRELIIGDRVRFIPYSAFEGCWKISIVEIPNSVIGIGANVFKDCRNLDTVILGDNVSKINYNTFYNCNNLKVLKLGNNLTEIGSYAFYNCNLLNKVEIPNMVTSIGNNAFQECRSLDSLVLGESITTIGDYAFDYCPIKTLVYNTSIYNGKVCGISNNAPFYQMKNSLQTLVIGENVQRIPKNAFNGCTRLGNVNFPESISIIGDSAFYGCLLWNSSIVMPSNIDTIGNYAFGGCSDVILLEMKNENPPFIYPNSFDGIALTVLVNIPCGSLSNYLMKECWSIFSNIEDLLPYQLSVSSNDTTMGHGIIIEPITCTNITVKIKAEAKEGYYFVEWSDGALNNPRQIEMTQDSSINAIFAKIMTNVDAFSNDTLKGNVIGSGIYEYAEIVTMTAISNSGYHFLCWSDGNVQNPRYINSVRDSVFTALFVSDTSIVSLSVNESIMGSVIGSGEYLYKNNIQITAQANYGYHFVQWSDGNIQNPRSIEISQDTNLTAIFAINTYTLFSKSNDSIQGSVVGSGIYSYLSEVELNVVPKYGYHFVYWNDGDSNNPRVVQLLSDTTLIAYFEINKYNINVVSNDINMGSTIGTGTYDYNTVINVLATPLYGYHFDQWNDGSRDNPRRLIVEKDESYIAQFIINNYSIDVNSDDDRYGFVRGGGRYNHNSNVEIEAIPNIGYHFVGWSDGNMENPRTILLNQDTSLTALFLINSYSLDVQCNELIGQVCGSGSYEYNSQVTLSALPNYGYHFVRWSDGDITNPRTLTVYQDSILEAMFEKNEYEILIEGIDLQKGFVEGEGMYVYDTNVYINAVANYGYHFVQWSDGNRENPRCVNLIKDTSFIAVFDINKYIVNVSCNDTLMGMVTGNGMYDYNSEVEINAVANYGYHFVQWNDGDRENPRNFIISSDTVFYAIYAINKYDIIVQSSDSIKGSVIGGGMYNYCSNVSLMATANYGYHFTQWSDGNRENPRNLLLVKDTTLLAHFDYNDYMMTVNSSDESMGSVSGGGTYEYLSQVAISATALPYHFFVQWSDGNTSNPRLVEIHRDTSFVAIFEEYPSYQVMVTSNDTTMGVGMGSGTYYSGEQIMLSASAKEHYYFNEWTDGNRTNPRTITVVGDVTYTATFTPYDYMVTLSANDNTMGSVVGTGAYPYGSEVEISASAFLGYHFVKWDDEDSNAIRTIKVLDNCQYTAIFEEDEDPEGIDDVVSLPWSYKSERGAIVVSGIEGSNVAVYDVVGKRIDYRVAEGNEVRIAVPSLGVYMLHVEGYPAQKVIVVR